ncbi:hypothetical protein LSTR_LSTR014285 [Laodelphax striatellus]|uniref:SURF1-like protein n=1 Tax=Laodelphax striatellus TaxID=195883 RepID=A0A482WU02_LAOST|nr:hypothetical protein LSTR_LSTR014285 [Laodelphax striatellus]
MDRNIAKVLQSTLTLYNRRILCSTRNNGNILMMVLRNNSNARLNVAEDKGTLLGLKAPKKQKSSYTTGVLLLSVPIVTFCLGTWQVRRREWKLNLIDELESKVRQPPIDLPEDLNELENLTYRRVKLRGRFDHSLEMYLGPRSVIHDNSAESEGSGGLMSTDVRARTGYLVVTPFILADSGKRILVNRGWVNTKIAPKERRPAGQIEEEVEITGIVRDHE